MGFYILLGVINNVKEVICFMFFHLHNRDFYAWLQYGQVFFFKQ